MKKKTSNPLKICLVNFSKLLSTVSSFLQMEAHFSSIIKHHQSHHGTQKARLTAWLQNKLSLLFDVHTTGYPSKETYIEQFLHSNTFFILIMNVIYQFQSLQFTDLFSLVCLHQIWSGVHDKAKLGFALLLEANFFIEPYHLFGLPNNFF